MHHRAVFAHQEGVPAFDFEVVSALDAVGAGDVEDGEAKVIAGFDTLAGGEMLGFNPACTFDVRHIRGTGAPAQDRLAQSRALSPA